MIPQSLRTKILEIIHHGHQGITKSRQRANGAVWWPVISRDISDMIYRCSHGQTYKTAQRKEPLITSPLPQSPWSKIGIDLLTFEDKQYLAVMDYYSRYLEVYLPGTTGNVVIMKLTGIFARWGIPLELVSDNGPQFDSRMFKDFALSSTSSSVRVTTELHEKHAHAYLVIAVLAIRSANTCVYCTKQNLVFYYNSDLYLSLFIS